LVIDLRFAYSNANEIFQRCVTLGLDASIRASVLLAMSRSWVTLGNQIEMYETIMEEEGRFT
jgi:hypothetical protein